jgi:PAS domain S-box-containing protein
MLHSTNNQNSKQNKSTSSLEKALIASEIRYRRLFESAKDGILILDSETGMIIDVNPFLIELLGYSKEIFIEKIIWEIGLFKDIFDNKDKFLELQQNKYVRYEDLQLETADGRKINVEFVSNVYLEDNQKVIQCNIRDITERKQDEKDEKSYRTLAENLPASVYRLYLREKGKMEFFNNIIEKISGYTKDELRKGEICSIDPFILAEDKPQVVEIVTKAIKNNSEFEVEYRFIRKDGVIKYFYEKGIPIMGEDGKPLFIEGVIFDITDRKKMETNLSTAAEMAKLGYWEFDVKSGNFIFDDQYYRLIHGSSTEKQGGNIMNAEEFTRKLVHPDDSKMIKIKLQEAISSTDPEYLGHAEARVFRDNGDITHVMVQFKVAKDQFGHAQTVYGINQNITERKLAEKELAESEERYKLLFQSAAEGILVVDVETKEFKLANKAVCQMFGYSEKEMTGLNIKDLHPKESLAYVLSEFESQAKGNRPFFF